MSFLRMGLLLSMVALAIPAGASEPAKPAKEQAAPASIGSATMAKDGTISLMLRATGGGAVGDALLTYPPSHKDYAMILKHLGGLKPGESKPVPPFPDEDPKPKPKPKP